MTNNDLSIHPGRNRRDYNPSIRADGTWTDMVPKDRTKGKLGKAIKRLEARRRDHAATIAKLPATTPPEAFRAPGSMK